MQMFFFAVEQDMRLLLREAESQGMAVYPANYPVEQHPPKLAEAMHYKVEEAPFLLLPREYSVDDIVYLEGSKGKAGRAYVELDDSPVIQVTPPVLWGTKLDVGSIEMNDESSDRRFSLTERKYGILANIIKRWHRTDKNQGYVGPTTEKLVREHRVQLGLGKKPVTLW